MIQLQINNPEMRNIFETKFHSNQDKFMEFIISFIKGNNKVVNNYFNKMSLSQKSESISYKKLDPMENFYKLSIDENNIEMTNPFKNIEDSANFAKKLREDSYR